MIIGTRGSELALKQADIFINKLKLKECAIKIIKTKGDVTKKPLQEVGTAIFTKELDKALLNKKIDLAVHSLKDIPVEGFSPKLEIAAIVERADPRDCLVGKIRNNAVVGTDSIRRQYELKNCFKDIKLNFKPIRGNIPTRIKKLENKEYDAIIVAKAALDRLKIKKSMVFPVKQMVPAAGQGAIAVVKRKNDKLSFLKKNKLYDCCMLEREFIKGMGGCKKPVGAYCEYKNRKFNLVGLVYKEDKRIMVGFSGNRKEIVDKIKKWKAKYT